jgi:menaquinone-dependent protoporphyrinogen oxidase
MATKALVTYGTKYGSTAEIADKIGEVLREEGIQTDVIPAGGKIDLSGYDAFIIGSAIYIGMWRKNVVKFITKNEKSLIGRPVWFFSSGPTGEGDPNELLSGWKYPKKLEGVINRLQPRDITVFHGVADSNKSGLFDTMIMRSIKAAFGDFRDWDAITAWAKSIAAELKK